MTEESTTPTVVSAGFTGGRFGRLASRSLTVMSATVIVVLLVGAGWIIWDDQQRDDLIPPGVSVDGVLIGGLTPAEAIAVVDADLAAPRVGGSLAATVESETYTIDYTEFASAEASSVVADAYALRDGTTVWDRARWVLFGEQLAVDLPLRMRIDESVVTDWLDGIASVVNTAAVEASRTVDTYAGVFEIVAPREGRYLDVHRSGLLVLEAFREGMSEIALPIEIVTPGSDGSDLGPSIHVDLSERRLYLYDGATLVKEYGVAIGSPGHPTPRGEWQIIQKRYMPSWGNPGSAWAANMPAYIPPGPSKPLGTRAMNLDAAGIRIHGTTQDWSIGYAASHGCMRMHRWDVEDLYERVEVGTPVFITS